MDVSAHIDGPRTPAFRGPALERVRIRNYKSIGYCGIALQPLTVLVGRNGSGKSNFLDGLRFVGEALQTSLDHAIKARGGIDAVRRRSTGHPRNFSIELGVNLPNWDSVSYGFEIGSRKEGGFVVKRERLQVRGPDGRTKHHYHIESGVVLKTSAASLPPAVEDRLFLVAASGLPEFRTPYDVLVSMGFYNLNPSAMKELQSPDAGELLHYDGSNIASVTARLGADEPAVMRRIKEYLELIVPGIAEVERQTLGPKETLQFRQEVSGSRHPWRFYAASMSDGTLRALGTLVAVTQLANGKKPVSLVGIEEPETALHPAAAGALVDALREARTRTQVVVTSHSPDLLDPWDYADAKAGGILVAVLRQGNTEIAPANRASLDAIRDHLYTPGELLRMDQLEPDPAHLERQVQMTLFDVEEGAP